MREMKKVRLGEIAEVVMGQAPSGSSYNLNGEGLPFIQGSREFGRKYPSPEKWCSAPQKIAEAGDILMSVRAPVGDINWADQRIAIGRGLAILRVREGHDQGYLKIALEHAAEELASASSSGMFASITKSGLSGIEIPLPSLDEQQRIVDLIGSMDDAIEAADAAAGATRVATAELRGELLTPHEGWMRAPLGDMADFDNGYPFKPGDLGDVGVPVIRIKQLLDESVEPDRSLVSVRSRQMIDDGDLVFSWSATIAVRTWNRGPALLNQHLFKVSEHNGVRRDFLRECLEEAIPKLHTHGTTMKHVTKKDLTRYESVLPPLKEQERIAGVLGESARLAEAADSYAQKLRAARSELLAVLLSGEHEIPESYDAAMTPAV